MRRILLLVSLGLLVAHMPCEAAQCTQAQNEYLLDFQNEKSMKINQLLREQTYWRKEKPPIIYNELFDSDVSVRRLMLAVNYCSKEVWIYSVPGINGWQRVGKLVSSKQISTNDEKDDKVKHFLIDGVFHVGLEVLLHMF
jgi:hypothetical protein